MYDEARQEARLAAPQYGLWSFRARMAADLAGTIVRQWLRTGWPIIAMLAILYPLTAASAIVSIGKRLFRVLPHASAAVDDILMLELLAAVVLLIVAATIILTLWFTRPLLYRHRR